MNNCNFNPVLKIFFPLFLVHALTSLLLNIELIKLIHQHVPAKTVTEMLQNPAANDYFRVLSYYISQIRELKDSIHPLVD